MKTVLILGAGGFIGSNLVKALEKDYQVLRCFHYDRKVHAYSNNIVVEKIDNNWHAHADLTNKLHVKDLFDWAEPDIVIHAAAVSTSSKDTVEAPWKHVTDNACMNALIFEACHIYGVEHVIWNSCGVMYQPKNCAQSEQDWNIAEEIFPTYFGVGSTKVYGEQLCKFYSRLGVCKFTAVRVSNCYGPGDKLDLNKAHVTMSMVKKICDATDKLTVWGSGKARRDLIYIDDYTSLVKKILNKQQNPFELVNCGFGQAFSINEIIDTILKITGKNLEIEYTNPELDIPTTVIFNCDKAKNVFDWEPMVLLEEGLTHTIEYYLSKNAS